MEQRIPKLGVAFGKKGVGKSYQTWQMIYSYVQGDPVNNIKPRRALILDVNDEYSWVPAISINDVGRFSNSPYIEVRRVRAFNERTGQPMSLDEIGKALFFILENYRRGLLLIEDINVYISDSLPNDLIGAICRNRHTELDIILHYQSLGRITPKVWQNVNWLRFHKNTDSVDRHKNKCEDKYEYLKITEILVNNKYMDGDIRFFAFIDVDSMKIRGKFTQEEISSAIDEYISLNNSTLVKPLISRINSDGGKVVKDLAEGWTYVRSRLLKQYTIYG